MAFIRSALLGLPLALVLTTGCSPREPSPTNPEPESPDPVQLPAILDRPASPEKVEAIFTYDTSRPMDVQVVDQFQMRDVLVEDLTFASPMGGRVPAFLWRPAESEGRLAAIVGMHGMPGDRHQLRETGEAYAAAGALLIGISGPAGRPDGSRRSVTFETPRDSLEQVQLIVDLRRAVDVLEARDDVDPDRIVFIGGSYGGAVGGLLAGVEHRFKAFVLMTGDGGVVTHFVTAGDVDGLPATERDRWLAAMAPIEPIRFVGLAAPRPLLFQNANFDEFVTRENATRYQDAGSEPKTIRWYDTGHSLEGFVFEDQAAWLEPILGIDLDRFEFPPPPP